MATLILKYNNFLRPQPPHSATTRFRNHRRVNFRSVTKNQQNISHQAMERRSANYKATTWSYDFLQSLKINSPDEIHKVRRRRMEEEVRRMINKDENDQEWVWKLELIDDIQRLALAYLFENDIKEALDRLYNFSARGSNNNVFAIKSLHATSLYFRLLRQHGYEVSQDVFKEFVDQKGNIKVSHHKDVKGMLSLYEASHLGYEEEDILDKSMEQTKLLLNNIINRSITDEAIVEYVTHGLELPLNRRMVLQEAKWYIESYNKKKDANLQLLELSKLEFNMRQSILQRDLKDMSKWWSDMDLARNLTFSRDRLVECFFWSVGMLFEPQYSNGRKGITKVAAFITTIDDVYDVYGTLDELELFTDAVERWEINAVGELPDYMRICFMAFYNTINEMAYDALKQQGENVVPHLTKAWADLFKTFLQEARWSSDKSTPSFEEYVENAWRSVSGTVLLVHAYFLQNQSMLNKEALDCLLHYGEVLRWSSVIFRLCNDLGSSSAELKRGETINSISCYMNDNGVSEEEAREHISGLINEAWKRLNKIKNDQKNPFSKEFMEIAINLARIAHYTYHNGDSHGAPDASSKNRVLSLIFETIN